MKSLEEVKSFSELYEVLHIVDITKDSSEYDKFAIVFSVLFGKLAKFTTPQADSLTLDQSVLEYKATEWQEALKCYDILYGKPYLTKKLFDFFSDREQRDKIEELGTLARDQAALNREMQRILNEAGNPQRGASSNSGCMVFVLIFFVPMALAAIFS